MKILIKSILYVRLPLKMWILAFKSQRDMELLLCKSQKNHFTERSNLYPQLDSLRFNRVTYNMTASIDLGSCTLLSLHFAVCINVLVDQ